MRSEPGRGTEIALLLPLALALLEVLLVERGGHVYGLPLSAVAEVVGVGEPLSLQGQAMIDLRGHSLALSDISAVIGASSRLPLHRVAYRARPRRGASSSATLVLRPHRSADLRRTTYPRRSRPGKSPQSTY